MEAERIEFLIQEITEKVWQKLGKENVKITIQLDKDKAKYPRKFLDPLASTVDFQLGKKKDTNSQALLIHRLTLQQMSAIKNLSSIDFTTMLAVKMLLKGLPVYILSTEYTLKQLREKTRYALYHEYQELEKKLENYGVHFVKDEKEWLEACEKMQKKEKQSTRNRRSILTENQLQKKWSEGVRAFEAYHLTPLAEDLLRKMRSN